MTNHPNRSRLNAMPRYVRTTSVEDMAQRMQVAAVLFCSLPNGPDEIADCVERLRAAFGVPTSVAMTVRRRVMQLHGYWPPPI